MHPGESWVPQSPGGTPVSIQDRQDPASQGFPEPATLPASSGAVRQVNRDGTIVDSTDDEPSVQRVSSVLAGSFPSCGTVSRTRLLAPHESQFQGLVRGLAEG